MTTENESPPIKSFVTCALPWLLGAGMFAVFLATCYRWVTPAGLSQLADVAGWSPSHRLFSPVTYLVTYPLRWAPVQYLPLLLNLFSVVCAALVLVLLARSVALLPHDRTDEQRQREQSEFSLLTIRTAWVPPLFAVLVCGLQMTFWENSIQATGEMFDLMILAYVIRCLLEYRITQKESWMVRFALVYGIGMANSYSMVGFFPAFLVAVVWIKGLGAFNPGFILRTFACGLAGLSLFFLFPILNSLSHTLHFGFWETIRFVLSMEKRIFTLFPRDVVALLGLTSLLPVFVIGIRWSSYFGDNSPLGIFLAKATFHIVHGVLLIICLWVALDSPISPRIMGYGLPFLDFYYLGALSIGYFSGYFLLIFGTKFAGSRLTLHPLLQLTNRCVLLIICLLVVAMPLILVKKNLPPLLENQIAIRQFDDYFAQIEGSLPPQGVVVLSDDTFRLNYLQATANRHGRNPANLFIDTGALGDNPHYLSFLAENNPRYQISTSWTNAPADAPVPLGKIRFLDQLARNHELYYIHPSFGYFFEHFYPQSLGLVYRLRPYPLNAWDAPVSTSKEIAENQVFWKKTFDDVLPPLTAILKKPQHPSIPGWWGQFLNFAHLKLEHNRLAPALGVMYSRSLDAWGVDLQRSGLLADAAKCFERAEELNPGNVAAHLNRLFNASLTAGQQQIIQPPKDIEERMGGRRGDILNLDGPIDEPNFRVDLASVMADGGNYRQAVQQLDRVKEVAPSDLRAPLQSAQLLLYIGTYTNALTVLLPYERCYDDALNNCEQAY